MAVPRTLPAPHRNQTLAGIISRCSGVASTDLIVALGDFTGGGAGENIFTLVAHGLATGDVLYFVDSAVQGVATGGPGTRYKVKWVSADVFQLTSGGTVVTNTADGTGIFLKGTGVPQAVADAVRSLLICVLGDTAAGTAEDMFVPFSGYDIEEGDSIKLLYKAAAGVAGTLDATTYVRLPVRTVLQSYFLSAATVGGAAVATTTDGLAVFLKTS